MLKKMSLLVLSCTLLQSQQTHAMEQVFNGNNPYIVAAVGVGLVMVPLYLYQRSHRYNELQQSLCERRASITQCCNTAKEIYSEETPRNPAKYSESQLQEYKLRMSILRHEYELNELGIHWSVNMPTLKSHADTSAFFGCQRFQDAKTYTSYLTDAPVCTRKTELDDIEKLYERISEAYCRGQYNQEPSKPVVSLMYMQASINRYIEYLGQKGSKAIKALN